MRFLENIKRKEQGRRRATAWSLAVGHLSRYVRHYLRKAEQGSALLVTPDLLRVGNVLVDRLTLFLDGETVTATPLALSDPRAGEGGCVMIRSTNDVTYYLLWDGVSPFAPDHWKIVRADDGHIADKVPHDEPVTTGALASKAEPLSESSLDEALGDLFGLVNPKQSQAAEYIPASDSARRIVSFTLRDKRSLRAS
jgi:hypothetical protein